MTVTAGDVVLITGASSGIGRETALGFARRRTRLVVAARSEDKLHELAAVCRELGAADVLVQPTDIGAASDAARLFDATLERFGRIDVVVQCAAITAFGRFEQIPADVFDSVMRTNLLGAANVARCALAHFQDREAGQLVLIGSLLGTVAVPYQSAYVASKFALNGLVRALRIENRHLPAIRVHGVYPGPVDTPVYGSSDNYFDDRTPRVPPSAVEPASIVAAIMRATDRRRSSERQVGWFNLPAIAVYRMLPAVFDAVIAPFLRTVAFDDVDRPSSVSTMRPVGKRAR